MKTNIGFTLLIALISLTTSFADEGATFDGGVAAESWSCALQCEIGIDYSVQESGLFGSYSDTETVEYSKTVIGDGPSAGNALQNTLNACESWSDAIVLNKRASDSLRRVKSPRTMPGYEERPIIRHNRLNKSWTQDKYKTPGVAYHLPSINDCTRN